MWPAQPQQWGQWPPTQPNPMYPQSSDGTIDWAALAQQWIAQKEAQEAMTVQQPPAVQPPPPAEGSGPPTSDGQPPASTPGDTNGSGIASAGMGYSQANMQPYMSDTWAQPAWPPMQAGWMAPPPNAQPPPPGEEGSQPQTFDYGHGGMQTFDHNHGSQFPPPERFDYNHGGAASAGQYGYQPQGYGEMYNQYWQGAPAPVPPPRERDFRGAGREREQRRDRSPPSPSGEAATTLDAAKRKILPAWIREGLEKMEREKQKAQEREQREREHAQRLEQQKEGGKEGLGDDTQAASPKSLLKSKYDSDEEEEEEKSKAAEESGDEQPAKNKWDDSEEEEEKTEEEKQLEFALKVRQMLTEVLLEVTNEEMGKVAREVYQRAKEKVAKERSIKLPDLSPLFFAGLLVNPCAGIGAYGSDSEDSNGGEEDEDVDSDVELMETIRRKQELHRQRELLIAQEPDTEGV
uniref:Uncharacterized protein n=1 Tax=Branchiostoma floridae TaxID=7739 RepID=C3YXC4_BRAFL|eukprot:XP_002599130.1 hypothetical protein BRAFLDRAFT_81797 [Branchiostoma floridae]